MEGLAGLDPHKVVLPIIAFLGIVPVVLQYRDESRWFVVGYLLLVVATLSTNLENLFLGTALNFTEHAVGLMGSGLAFLAAAYFRRERVLAEDGAGNDGAVDAPGTEV